MDGPNSGGVQGETGLREPSNLDNVILFYYFPLSLLMSSSIDWLLPSGQVKGWNGQRGVNTDNSRFPSSLLNHNTASPAHHLSIYKIAGKDSD